MSQRTIIHTCLTCFLFSILLISCKSSFDSTEDLMTYYELRGRRKIGSPFSGTVLIAKNDQVVFTGAYGFSNRSLKKPNTLDTRFPVGSVTKQFTAMLVMQMVEQGDLDLDDPIVKHLPYLASTWSEQITLHQLLSHTSGLPHYDGLLGEVINRNAFAKTAYTPKELAVLIDQVELDYPIDTKFHYSSLGYMLLGVILEEVSGQSYSTLLQQNITTPLGLKNTGFASNEFIAAETARGYAFVEDESFMMIFNKLGGDFEKVPFRDQSNKYSTGGIHSTVEDLWVWSKAIRNNILLSKEYTDLMLTPNQSGYCYGWFRNWDELIERNKNVKMYTHGGALFGHRASINLFDDGTTIIYLANTNRIKDQELTHQLYLSTHHLKDTFGIKGYPDRSSMKRFHREGGLTALKRFFHELSERSGYEVLPSENSIVHIMSMYYENGDVKIADSLKQAYFTYYEPTEGSVNALGYQLLEDRCNIALTFFKENTVRFPESPNVWDSYGEGLMSCGEKETAIECHQRAVQLAEKTKDRNLEVFQQNLDRAIQLRAE
ncbi:MAG: serine hydrolase domain-containing protein [Cytophagales bacterium]|nr:serine hydrolase domain-containing protein [Cytophagales bacterium]